ncbi:hypothetical protein [Janthinobacterium psychrotolerans]|nr:hypothetical protein [Janthinobacterium psychrotolerans]
MTAGKRLEDAHFLLLGVVCPHVDRQRQPQQAVSLGMHGRGVSIVLN